MENTNAISYEDACVIRGSNNIEEAGLHGYYDVKCFSKDGDLKWEDTASNIVTTAGKNYALTGFLQTAVTIVGPFMGLISGNAYISIPVIGDTMASHATWAEAGGGTNGPQYAARITTVGNWAAASGGTKATSTPTSFTITGIVGSAIIKGCFMVLSTGAVTTNLDTNGTLYSAGLFSADKTVASGDVLQVSYTASLG